MAVMDGRAQRFDMDGSTSIDPYMTKRQERITKALEDIVGIVSEHGVTPYEYEDGAPDSLRDLIERIWTFAQGEVCAWASEERYRARWHAWRDREAAEWRDREAAESAKSA